METGGDRLGRLVEQGTGQQGRGWSLQLGCVALLLQSELLMEAWLQSFAETVSIVG